VKTLLLGMGNPILSDDAVGVRLARDIGRRLSYVTDIDIVEECSVGGLNILDIVAGFDRLIVLDSIRTARGVPGEWHRFTAGALRDTMHLNNIHDVNFATALELGRRMGMPLPTWEDIHIFTVEVQDNETFSEAMTEPLERSYPEYFGEILVEIEEILAGSDWQPSIRKLEAEHDESVE
jgi:hydrogenase maturation protease